MKRPNLVFFNILLGLTTFCFIVALFYFFNNPLLNPTSYIFAVCLYFQLIFGVFAIFWSTKKTKKAYQLFLGLIFLFWSVTSLFFFYFSPKTINSFWPIYGAETGIMLFISGLYKYKKLKFGYLFPSVTLFIICFWYFLFTLKIIDVPFSKVARISIPIFFFTIAILLILFFILQKKNKKFFINDEEQGSFSDEEILLEDDNDFNN